MFTHSSEEGSALRYILIFHSELTKVSLSVNVISFHEYAFNKHTIQNGICYKIYTSLWLEIKYTTHSYDGTQVNGSCLENSPPPPPPHSHIPTRKNSMLCKMNLLRMVGSRLLQGFPFHPLCFYDNLVLSQSSQC